jgi:hypothetical protein
VVSRALRGPITDRPDGRELRGVKPAHPRGGDPRITAYAGEEPSGSVGEVFQGAVMSRLLVVSAVTVAASLLAPNVASADMSDCSHGLERSYSKHYRQVHNRLGARAPGRNIRKYGVLYKGTTFHAVCSEIRRSNRQLLALLSSPPYSHSEAVPPSQPPAGVESDKTVANGGSSNSMVNPNCESGGNPQVYDPSGTYWGKYQFDRQTWVAHGGSPGSYGSAPEWEQDQVASRVTYDAWPNC